MKLFDVIKNLSKQFSVESLGYIEHAIQLNESDVWIEEVFCHDQCIGYAWCRVDNNKQPNNVWYYTDINLTQYKNQYERNMLKNDNLYEQPYYCSIEELINALVLTHCPTIQNSILDSSASRLALLNTPAILYVNWAKTMCFKEHNQHGYILANVKFAQNRLVDQDQICKWDQTVYIDTHNEQIMNEHGQCIEVTNFYDAMYLLIKHMEAKKGKKLTNAES